MWALSDGGDALEASEARDAVRALGVEGVRAGGAGRGQRVVMVVGRGVALVAIFYGGGAKRGEGGCRGVGGSTGRRGLACVSKE